MSGTLGRAATGRKGGSMKRNRRNRFVLRGSVRRSLLVAAALRAACVAAPAFALPTGGQVVVPGTATIGAPVNHSLTVINQPGAIIHWQSFSIAPNELVRFVQQNAASAVLNRVTGPQMSEILGRLQSNGQVFLINPNGIIVGPNAVIDTAAFVGSTLRLTDADFLAGRLRFQGDGSEGRIVNQGRVRSGYGGRVLLVAPQIENSGLIEAPGGSVLLAAGRSLTISGLDPSSVHFEVQAPADTVLNLGQLSAPGGAVGVFAGTLRHSGEIRAHALTRDAGGHIVLQARDELTLAAGSRTSADGRSGGSVVVESTGGVTRVEGRVSATGSSGAGGSVQLLGQRVSLAGDARIDASGASDGGTILAGGDWQGANPNVRNAERAFVGAGVRLAADATDSGDGGRIVVWSDGETRFLGSLSARGGPHGGNGGMAEVSGREELLFIGGADLGAPRGAAGSLLLDPRDLFIDAAGGLNPFIIDEATDFPNNAVTVSPATLAAITGNVTLYASRDLRFNSSVVLTNPGQSLSAVAGRDIQVGAGITTSDGAVSLAAARAITIFGSPSIAAGSGAVTLSSGTGSLAFGTVTSAGSIAASSGGALTLGNLTASGPVTLTAAAALGTGTIGAAGAVGAQAGTSLATGAIATTGNVSLTAGTSIGSQVSSGGGAVIATAGSSLSLSSVTSAGGALTGSAGTTVSIGGGDLGSGNATLTGTSVSIGSPLTTTGSVVLTATAGNIHATINEASAITASASRSLSSVSVVLTSTSTTTPLHATSVTATAINCFSSSSCPGASISLSGQRGVAVGTVTANAPVTFRSDRTAEYQSRSRSVTVNGQDGPISALGAGSLITATDVTLRTNQGAGGGIGSAALPVRVSAERSFDFRPNGEFNALLNGPNQFSAQLGVAAAGQSYTGTLSKPGELALSVSATDTTVTVDNFAVTGGFNRPVYGSTPSISLSVPNGDLVATNVEVPAGDQSGFAVCPPGHGSCSTPSIVGLNVSLSAAGAAGLTIANYTRATGAHARNTAFSASAGPLVLGTIRGALDSISASGRDSVTVTDLETAGNVTVTSSPSASAFGNVLVDRLQSIGGHVTITGTGGTVAAATDGAAVEITALLGHVSITAASIGASGLNPLDIAAASVSLAANGSAPSTGYIGSGATPANPVTAATPQLTIHATGQFHVDTGAVPLVNLTVTASPSGVGNGGTAQVRSDGALFPFLSNGTNFTLSNLATTTQFNGGTLSFTTTGGNLLFGNIDFSATGGSLLLRTNQNATGDVTRIAGPVNLGSGVLTVRADRDVTLGDPMPGGELTAGGLSVASVNGSFPGPGACEVIGSYFVCATNTVTAGNITDPTGSGSFSATTRRAIMFGNLDGVGSVSFNAASLGVTTGTIGSASAPASSVSISTESTSAGGNIVTGAIEAHSIDLRSRGTISTGGAAINAGTSASGASVFVSGTGAVTIGSINSGRNPPGSVDLRSDTSIVTGTIHGDHVALGRRSFFAAPSISAGAIGDNIRPAQSIRVQGTSVTLGALTSAGDVDLYASGTMLLGGDIVAGAGRSVTIQSNNTGALLFSRIDTGAGGSVTINNPNGIEQTLARAGGGGITARTVGLHSGGGASTIGGPGADNAEMTLREVAELTLVIGNDSRIRLTGATGAPELTRLDLTRGRSDGVFVLDGLASTQTVTVAPTATGVTLAVNNTGAAPLAFRYRNTHAALPDIAVTSIVTNGGAVTLEAPSGALAVAQIDSTGGPLGDGNVTLSAGGSATFSGLVDVDAGAGSITVTANGVFHQASSTGRLSSNSAVYVSSSAASIGTASDPLRITAPEVEVDTPAALFLDLTDTTRLTASVVNDLSVTSSVAFDSVDLRIAPAGSGATSLAGAGQSFGLSRAGGHLHIGTISSTAPIASLALRTQGAGGIRVFGSGASLINAGHLTLDTAGDLLFDGTGSALLLTNTSQSFYASGGIRVDGVATLTASGGAQTFHVSGSNDLVFAAAGGAIAVSGASQTLHAGRDIRLLGGSGAGETVTLSASGAQQTLTAGQDIVAGAGTGLNASVAANASGGAQVWRAARDILLTGGGTAGGSEAATVVITQSGPFEQRFEARGSIVLTGGPGADSSVTLVQSGGGSQLVGDPFPCCNFYRTTNVRVLGGAGDRSYAEIASNGPQYIQPIGALEVRGGDGAGAHARIASTSSSEQRIGAPSYFYWYSDPVDTITVAAGAGTDAYAEIINAGFQRVTASASMTLSASAATGGYALLRGAGQDVRTGATSLLAGTGSGADARIESTGSGLQYLDPSSLTLTAGGTAGTATAVAKILSGGAQQIVSAGTTVLTAGEGPDSDAAILAAGNQSLAFGNTTLRADPVSGGGFGSNAEIRSSGGSQSLSFGSLVLTGGTAGATGVLVQAAAGQSISAGATTLTGGTGTAGNDSGATIVNLAGNQSFSASSLAIRSGPSHGRAGIVNFGGNQSVSGTITITTSAGANLVDAPFAGSYHAGIVQSGGGTQTIGGAVTIDNAHSAGDIGIVNRGSSQMLSLSGALNVLISGAAGSASIDTSAGTQSITANGGVVVRVASGSGTARIVNTGGDQTLQSSGGGVQVQANGGSGTARITASGAQNLPAVRFLEVATASGATGNAELVAGGNQSITTTNGFATGYSVKVTALGTGTARIEAAGNQLIEADYPFIMQQSVLGNRDGRILVGDPAALGPSWIRGVDQDLYARAILVRGGSTAAATAKLDASGQQTISILTPGATPLIPAGITVAGGAGGSAEIDPVLQTIVANGPIQVLGGSGPGTFGLIQSFGPQTVLVTNAPVLDDSVLIQGGSGINAYAAIATTGPTMQLGTSGGITLIGGTGVNADAVFGAGSANQTALACGSGFLCSFANLTTNPFANSLTDVGVFSNPVTVALGSITAPLPGVSTGLLVFDPSTGLLLATLGDLDRALEGDEDEQRAQLLFGRRLLLCR
jgi:filamentous hemagglutinin family protein